MIVVRGGEGIVIWFEVVEKGACVGCWYGL
jgi:hypothetical protein